MLETGGGAKNDSYYKKNENVFLIAKKYKVKLNDLIEANTQIPCPEVIITGQLLNIPIPVRSTQSQPVTINTYVVQKGDTLHKIAGKFGVTLAALIAANPQIADPKLIHPGQKINIPEAAAKKEVAVSITVIGYDKVLVPQRTINVTNFDLRPYIGNNA
jgi:spore coat assembly protein SafA